MISQGGECQRVGWGREKEECERETGGREKESER